MRSARYYSRAASVGFSIVADHNDLQLRDLVGSHFGSATLRQFRLLRQLTFYVFDEQITEWTP